MAVTQTFKVMAFGPPFSALLASEVSWRSYSSGNIVHLSTDRSWTPKRQPLSTTPSSTNLHLMNYTGRASKSRFLQTCAAAPTWAVSLCDELEEMVFTSELPSPTAEMDQCMSSECSFLCTNCEPVPEMAPTTDLPVAGTIPECMYGEYMRVGPNPRYLPRGGYHWFDGDGMIHGLHMKDGKATYLARFVQTIRLKQEEHYGGPKFLKVGDLKGMKGFWCAALHMLRLILGILDKGFTGTMYAGNANTGLVYHNKKILALQEYDKPHIIKVLEDGDLQTVGLEDFKQRLDHGFAAHPKIDPVTGEMFSVAFGMPGLLRAPQFIYHVVSEEGILGKPVTITTSYCMMHDFAITENYAVFMDLPICFDFLGMAQGEFVLKFDPSKESRLGVLPRYATNDSKIRWFTIPTCCIFHTLNAWEEGDEALLICCRMDDVNIEYVDCSKIPPKLCEYRLNLRTGDVKHRQLSSLPVDFPRINPEYTGRKVRYGYCTIMGDEESGERFKGVAKFDFDKDPDELPTFSETSAAKLDDLETSGGNIAGLFIHGPGRCGGDTIFVPRDSGVTLGAAAEDDGYLITYVHDEITGKSEAVIIDAKTMGPDPVAVIELPGRVPLGFHALFVSQEQLQHQA